MANKSFEFKIGADTSDFIKKMDSATFKVKALENQAKTLEDGLKINFDDGRFQEAQRRVKSALELTELQAQKAREELKYLEDSGRVDTKEYDKLKSKLVDVENKAVLLKERLKEIENLKFTNLANSFDKVGQGFTQAGKSLMGVSAVAGATLAGITKLTTATVAQGDEIATLASKYGMSAEEIQKWQYVAMQSDVENTSLYKGIQKLNVALADLTQGEMNNATKALQDLGLGATASFDELINSLMSLEDVTTRNYYANQIFGDKLGTEIIPLLNQGKDAINEYLNEFQEVGYLSDEVVNKLASFDNTMNKFKQSLKQAGYDLGVALMPILENFVEILQNNIIPAIQNITDKFNQLDDGTKKIIGTALLAVAAIAPLLLTIGKISSGIGSILKLIPALQSGLTALSANPIVLIIGVIAGLIALLYARSEKFRELIGKIVESISNSLGPVLEALMEILQPIFDIVMELLDMLMPILEAIITPLLEQLKLFMPVLQAIGQLTAGLTKIFGGFGGIVKSIFQTVLGWVNKVLGFISDAINWVIDRVNDMINLLNKIPGVDIDEVGNINLRINTDELEEAVLGDENESSTASDLLQSGSTAGIVNNSTNNYDYSNKTQNIEVVIQNYAENVDTDALIEEINIKLAELM